MKKFIRILITYVLSFQAVCSYTYSADAFDTLRPQHLSSSGAVDLAEELQTADKTPEEAPPASGGMTEYHGTGTPFPATAFGKAAIVSTYSAYDILCHLKFEDIERERDELLPTFITSIQQEVSAQEGSNPALLAIILKEHKQKVSRYYSQHLQTGPLEGRLIRNRIGALEFFLSIDLRKAYSSNDHEKVQQLKMLMRAIQKHAKADIDTSTTMNNLQAEEEWQRFSRARDELIKENKDRQEACKKHIRELAEKIEALNLRNSRLKLLLQAAQKRKDRHEIESIRATIEENRKLAEQCEKTKKDFIEEINICDVNIVTLNDLSSTHIKGAAEIFKRKRTVLQTLYMEAYAVFDGLALNTDRFTAAGREYHKLYVEGMRRAESMIARLTNVVPFYLKTDNERDDHVIFANHEIPVEAIYNLARKYPNKIKAIVCLEGTITSHWVIVAQSLGIPVVILQYRNIAVEDMMSLGDDIIVETTQDQAACLVITKPDMETRHRYGLASLRQQLYDDLCREQHILRRHTSIPSRLSVYANVANAKEAEEAFAILTAGIGLFRTEIDPGEETKEALIALAKHRTERNRRRVLKCFVRDVSSCMKSFRSRVGPFTVRTDDMEDDKNIAHILEMLPETERATGFNLYRTELGRELVTLRIASVIMSLCVLKGAGGYSFTPTIIFPMVKEERDMHYVHETLIPLAKEIVLRYTDHTPSSIDNIVNRIKIGPMIETVEAAVDNIDSLIVDTRTSTLSGGNNDLTESVLSRAFGIDITRDDRHFGTFFYTLKPEVCEVLVKVAEAISAWNLEHPDNIKTLGFCGAIAEVEEFILFAAFLQKKYNIPVYLSVHPRSVAIVDNFVNFIQDEDLGIFVAPKNWNAFLRNKNGDWAKLTPEIGFKTHKFAKAKVKEIRRRIEESELYRLNVEQRVNQIKQLGVIENGNAKPIQLPNAVAEHAINSGA